MGRRISWFSCGAASAVATKLSKPDVIAYCETGSEHTDNRQFEADCVGSFNQKIEHLKSDKYSDTWDVWEKTRWLAGVHGARCTTELKVMPRLVFQCPTDIHIFGYTADGPDIKRADNKPKEPERNYRDYYDDDEDCYACWEPSLTCGKSNRLPHMRRNE